MLRRKPILTEWWWKKILSDERKFERVTVKNVFLYFAVNQEKCISKNVTNTKSMLKEIRKSIKPVGTRSGTMYGLYKVHRPEVDSCTPI